MKAYLNPKRYIRAYLDRQKKKRYIKLKMKELIDEKLDPMVHSLKMSALMRELK